MSINVERSQAVDDSEGEDEDKEAAQVRPASEGQPVLRGYCGKLCGEIES